MKLFSIDPTIFIALLLGGVLFLGYNTSNKIETLPVSSPQGLIEESIQYDLNQATNSLEQVEQILADSESKTVEAVMLIEASQEAIRQAVAKLQKAVGILTTRNIR